MLSIFLKLPKEAKFSSKEILARNAERYLRGETLTDIFCLIESEINESLFNENEGCITDYPLVDTSLHRMDLNVRHGTAYYLRELHLKSFRHILKELEDHRKNFQKKFETYEITTLKTTEDTILLGVKVIKEKE